MLIKTLIAAITLTGAGAAGAANLLTNGSFETPNPVYAALGTADTSINGWTTFLSGVEHFNPSAYDASLGAAADGLMAVDLANVSFLEGGGIQQALSTVNGQLYQLSFAVGSSNYVGRGLAADIQLSIGGGAPQNFLTDATSQAAITWKTYSLNFTGTGSSMMLAFSNKDDPNTHFAFLDDVSVTAVPEPASYAMMLGGLAVVGGIARRRRAAS